MKVRIRFKQDITEFGIYLMITSLLMILFCEPFGLTTLVSIGVWSTFIATFLILITAIIEVRIYKNPITVCTVLLFIIAVFSMIVSDQLSYKSIVSLVSLLEIPIFILAVNKLSSPKITIIIYNSFLIISLFFIILSFSPLAHIFRSIYGESYLDFLTLGYDNPNKTGMLLFGCFSVLYSYLFFEENRIKRFIILAIDVYLLLLIIQTESRACIIVSFLLIIFSFIKKHTVINIISKVCYAVPIIFAPLCIIFPNLVQQTSLMGDSLDTGRLSIYVNVMENMNLKNFLVGNYGYEFRNLHNSYFTLFATIGILGAIIFAILYFYIISKLYYTCEKKFNMIPFMAISLYLLHSSVEAAMFLSGSSYAVIIIVLYILCINNFHKNTEILQ